MAMTSISGHSMYLRGPAVSRASRLDNVHKDRLEAGPVDCGECAVIWVVTDTTIPAGHSESVECTVGTKTTDENLQLRPGLNTGAGSK